MADLNEIDEQLCATSRWDFSDLRALFVNCTLKRSPEISHTQALGDRSIAIMQRNGVTVDTIRAVDHHIATGIYPDMTEHGWAHDAWPAIHERVMAADILVLLSPIWLGEKSSVCTQVVERLYGTVISSTRTGSTRTTAASAAASSPATRTAPSTAR
jgi:multimeric flavodoxin WrbA